MRRTIPVHVEDMLIFAAVAQHGSFSRAAEALGLRKQGVSARVQRLEATLGVRLLERTTRRVRPTEAGRLYAERCHAIVTQVAEANDLARQRQTEPVGTLRIASPTLFGRRFLTPAVHRYVARYPRMQVAITLTNRPVDLIGDGFDLAIHVGALRDSSLTARRLADGRLFYVASPEYLARHGTPTPHDLAEARCLAFRETERWRVDALDVPIHPVIAVNDVEALHALAVAGAGIAQLPSFVCDAALQAGQLVRLFPEAHVPVRRISVLYPSRTFLAARVERFLDELTRATDALPN